MAAVAKIFSVTGFSFSSLYTDPLRCREILSGLQSKNSAIGVRTAKWQVMRVYGDKIEKTESGAVVFQMLALYFHCPRS